MGGKVVFDPAPFATGSRLGTGDSGGALPQSGGEAGSGGAPATGGATADGPRMTFTVTTVVQGGQYRPKNVGAIWIADASGNWVKTLKRWAQLRRQYLTRFNATGADLVDAITGPTLTSHQTHTVTWDLTDANGDRVEPGDYQVIVECTDKDATGESTSVTFSTADGPGTEDYPDSTYFKDLRVELQE